MGKKIKIITICAALLVVFAVALVALRAAISSSGKNETTYTVRKETYEDAIEISGTVDAGRTKILQARGDGAITGVFVKEGDFVREGDLLFQIDDSIEKMNLAEASSNAARAAWQKKIEDKKIYAPFDGLMSDVDVEVGDPVLVTNGLGKIVDLNYLTAIAEVAENDAAKIKVGQKVKFTFSAAKNENVVGTVQSLSQIGILTSRGATAMNVIVRIDDYPKSILPNYTYTGKIELSPATNYLFVERYAVGYDGGEAFVELAKTGEKVSVQIEPYGNDYVKIISGLKGGEVLKQQSKPLDSGWKKDKPATPAKASDASGSAGGNPYGHPTGGN